MKIWHSLLYSLSAISICLFSTLGWQLSPIWMVVLFIGGVILIGLPHGGLDHIVGTAWLGRMPQLKSWSGASRQALFFATYLAISSVVILGWYILTVLTIATFFLLSAWHFGLEEEYEPKTSSIVAQIGIIARGGMLMWIPAFCSPTEMTDLLATVIPAAESNTRNAEIIVESLAMLWPLFLTALLGDLYRIVLCQPPTVSLVHFLRIGSTILLFSAAPIIVGFAVYFCGWHSICGWSHLRDESGLRAIRLVKKVVPMTALATLMIAAAFLWFSLELSFTNASVRVIFLGLSALAIPHLLLHILVDLSQDHAKQLVNHPGLPNTAEPKIKVASNTREAWSWR